MSDNYIVKPVYKALHVLTLLGETQQELSLTEISHRIRLPKTTVFRYLHTLCELGFASHDTETDTYRVGLRLWELGRLTSDRQQLRELALPHMRELRERFNETVNLGVLQHRAVVYLEMEESRHTLRTQAKVGSRDPVYSTALGKAMLAFVPPDQWADYLPPQLVPFTGQTVTSLAVLRQQLEQARAQGYALDVGENEEGAVCIGAPIFDERQRVAGAISLSAPASRLDGSRRHEVATAVHAAAAAISQRLGYRAGG